MGRLSEYEEWDGDDYELLRANPRDEYLTRAYIDGRNAARDGKSRSDVTDLYAHDPLAGVNWEVGYDDWHAEQIDEQSNIDKGM